MQDAPLDMRMDRQQKLTAYDVVNGWSREEIRHILFEYGEEALCTADCSGDRARTRRQAD